MKYVAPEFEIAMINAEDIIATSGEGIGGNVNELPPAGGDD